MSLVGSGSVQTWIISPSHYHLKGERKGLCELPSPSSTASSSQETVCTMKEALGRGLTPEAARLCQNRPGTVGLARHLLAAAGMGGRQVSLGNSAGKKSGF